MEIRAMTQSLCKTQGTSVSVLELFSIGIGPSSSHTVGPMRAAYSFAESLFEKGLIYQTVSVTAELYGSLAMTGLGHATDMAICLGFMGYKPETIDSRQVESLMNLVKSSGELELFQELPLKFSYEQDLIFHRGKRLPFHSNGMKFSAYNSQRDLLSEEIIYSTGGGFILNHKLIDAQESVQDRPCVPYPYKTAEELLEQGRKTGLRIDQIVLENEKAMRSEEEVKAGILRIWQVMQDCVQRGISTSGILPGGLQVRRRAQNLHQKLKNAPFMQDPSELLDWVSLYALAVNEENAAGGQVVTAPTNGASGVIPAVLHYYMQFVSEASIEGVIRFFLAATAIGILFKEGASLSAAEMGCQGEVGVACSMAAGGLVAALNGTNDEIENAAEIGMEHNLGLTCDPIAGLVQIPCIERNTKGAIMAINAARLAMHNKGDHRVSLDQVIMAMRKTGEDMNSIYKETSEGGLALYVPVNLPEC